jgi:5,10-methylenetetrahydromethanopterin reductase
MEDYIRTYQALLAGETVDWEGAPIKLMLTSAQGDALPLRIPLLVSAIGPKGASVAHRLGADGIIAMFQVLPQQRNHARAVVAVFGTVLDGQEDPAGERVRSAVGPPWAGMFHFVYTGQGAAAVAEMPGGASWLDVIEKIPERERHLFIHQGHMVEMNDADMAAWRAGGHISIRSITLTGPAETIGEAVAVLARDGTTEVMIQPSGPDIPRELETFIAAVRG